MDHEDDEVQALFEKELITAGQFEAVKAARSHNLFSLHNEIRIFFFISVMLFTSGTGIIIYKNIDSIGHIALLGLILAVALGCYYYCFRHAPGFSKQQAAPQKPLYDYLVLTAHLLSGIFIAYLQYQYSVFGTHNDISALIPVLLYFFGAYYFDHKGVLSLAITAWCAFLGFSASPTGMLHLGGGQLAGYAMATALACIGYVLLAEKYQLKEHFNVIYQNFALHLLCTACIIKLFDTMWLIPLVLMIAGSVYFVKLAYARRSAYFLSFIFIYDLVALSCVLGRLMAHTDDLIYLIAYLGPFYLAGAIVLFIKSLKHLKKQSPHDDHSI